MAAVRSLKHYIMLRLAAVAVAASLLMLALFQSAYRAQLEKERSDTSLGFNLLLQAALENAMLKRDVPGLADIVARLGTQPGIRRVMILNPSGEVRFSSSGGDQGSIRADLLPVDREPGPKATFVREADMVEVLRSINPVSNKPQCAVCHGTVAKHPLNGILVIDYDASEIRRRAWLGASVLALAGSAILVLMLALLWHLLDRRVLRPVARLAETSAAIEAGNLDRRVAIDDNDELGLLGRRFNGMASRLAEQMARIREHELYLQEIIDGLPDGIRVFRAADRRMVLANRAYCDQLGQPRASAVGMPCHASSHGQAEPCVPTLVSCPLEECRASGAHVKSTHLHRRTDGTVFPVEVHAARIDIGGEAYIVESVRDLAAAAHVSQEQRLSELGLLAAGVAHEIHNPLASVRLGVQSLLREVGEGRAAAGRIRDYLQLVDGEIDSCIAVTRRLLMLSRLPSSSLQLVDVIAALDDTMRLLDFDAQSRHIEQRLERPDKPVHVLADDGELRMAFLNLFQNAHHAMPDGGIMTAGIRAADGMAIIDIADTGIGIAPDILPHIFDPFFSRRADGVVGTGLGLTIVSNTVERLGGRIDVKSSPGQGSCFTLHLKLAERTTS